MNYQLIKTSDELRKAIENLATQPVVGLDTETTELDPYTSRLRLIQLATTDRVYIIDFDHFANGDSTKSDALAPLRRLLEAPRPIKIAHNAKFDAKFIKHNLGVDLGGLFDTLLASQLVGAGDIEERHGLETVASRYLNEAVDKSERLSNWNFELTEAQLEYAARDAAILLPLREKLIERLKSESLVKCAQLEFECVMP
ncbi:MAG TPA: ribonuclease D, partial [Pyrinomonadaceae bacterium]|nr:ribonuclease D [Pyrinomonadaceae bacterium]